MDFLSPEVGLADRFWLLTKILLEKNILTKNEITWLEATGGMFSQGVQVTELKKQLEIEGEDAWKGVRLLMDNFTPKEVNEIKQRHLMCGRCGSKGLTADGMWLVCPNCGKLDKNDDKVGVDSDSMSKELGGKL